MDRALTPDPVESTGREPEHAGADGSGPVRGGRGSSPLEPSGGSPPRTALREDLGRLAQVLLGLFSVGYGVIVLAQPQLSLTGFLLLLGAGVAFVSAQTVFAGGQLLGVKLPGFRGPQAWWHRIQSWGIVGVGVVAFVLAAFAVLDPALAVTAAVFVLAIALVALGFGRIFQASGVTLPRWLRGSALGTGLFIVVVVVIALAFNGFAVAAFSILVGVILLITGIETVVAGLRPTDPRQFVLLKLILFAAFYGLILINWIDLFGKTVPAYGIWLLLTYLAPFGVLIVFEGWDSFPLAASLGLLVSLFNDVGYFFIGNLIFGFHENLGPWIAGQLGFLGSQTVTYFEAGAFTITVASWMMGLSIYLRALVVGAILYYWWRHPGRIVAKMEAPTPATSN